MAQLRAHRYSEAGNRIVNPFAALLVAAALILVSLPAAAEQPLFDAGRLFNAACEPRGGATGDFDGDGDIDIALACPDIDWNSGVTVLLNDGQGGFGEPQHVLLDNTAGWYIDALDVDNDGDLDLACPMGDELQILKNNGQGVFWAAQVSYTGQQYLRSMTHGDFDGDGHQDLAALTGAYQNIVLVLWGSGNGLFNSYLPLILENEPLQVESADFDSNGLPDLAVMTDYDQAAMLFLSNGNRTFSNAQPLGDTGERPEDLQVADVDGDGHADVVFGPSGYSTPREIVVYWGSGNGTFPATSRLEFGSHLDRIAVADLDYDGDNDLAALDSDLEQFHALLNTGGRSFAAAPLSATSGWIREFHLFDVNGDDFLDLVAQDENEYSGRGGVMVFRGLGDGTISAPRREPIDKDSTDFVCDDFDRDGVMDLAISVPDYSSPEFHVRLGNGDGSFDGPTVYLLDDDLGYLEVSDFNLDGYPDLLTLQTSYEIRLGSAGGNFQPPLVIDTGHPQSGVAVADLNQDTAPDLMISSREDAVVSILLGDGAGGFQQLADLAVGGEPWALAAADFTGDGLPDLAVHDESTFPDEQVHVFPGNGDGSFGTAVTSLTAYYSYLLIPADLDGDSNIDLVVTDGLGYDFFILMGNGDGTFDPCVEQGSPSRIGRIQVEDADGDGLPQVIAHLHNDQEIALYTVDGAGTATCTASFGVSLYAGAFQLADVDNDGDLDLLVTSVDLGEESSMWVINNTSTSRFFAAGPGPGPQNPPRVRLFDTASSDILITQWNAYAAGGYGVNSAIGDLDGDGRPEVVSGPGPGAIYGPHVRGFRSSGAPIPAVSYLAYGTNRYGVNVALGDTDADGFAEIVTGAGPGAVFGPHVRGWNWDGSGTPQPIPGLSYFAYGTPKWGVNVACGDIDGDGCDEIVTGAGPGAVYGPHVRGWDVDGGGAAAISAVSFMAYGTLKYGVNVACGDIDGDGIDEMVTGAGPGTVFYPHVRAWNWDGGGAVASISAVSFIAYNLTQWGVNVSCGDLDGDGIDEILTGPGPGPTHWARVRGWNYDGTVLAPMANLDFDAFDGVVPGYGVKVAGARH